MCLGVCLRLLLCLLQRRTGKQRRWSARTLKPKRRGGSKVPSEAMTAAAARTCYPSVPSFAATVRAGGGGATTVAAAAAERKRRWRRRRRSGSAR